MDPSIVLHEVLLRICAQSIVNNSDCTQTGLTLVDSEVINNTYYYYLKHDHETRNIYIIIFCYYLI